MGGMDPGRSMHLDLCAVAVAGAVELAVTVRLHHLVKVNETSVSSVILVGLTVAAVAAAADVDGDGGDGFAVALHVVLCSWKIQSVTFWKMMI